MRSPNSSAINALDAAAQAVPRVAAPWMGVLWLTGLPLRMLQVYFIAQLARLDAPWTYFHYFLNLAAWLCAAFVFSLYGRAVFVRACRFARYAPARLSLEPFKVPLADFLPYLYTALLIEIFFYLSLMLIVGWPLAIIFAGLAAASSQGIGGPKLLRAPLEVLRIAANWKPLLGASLIFALALVYVYINLYMLVRLLLFAAAPLLGDALARWELMLSAMWENFPLLPANGIVTGLLCAGTVLIVEPFWLAANVELAQMARARRSGDDLRLWLARLKSCKVEAPA